MGQEQNLQRNQPRAGGTFVLPLTPKQKRVLDIITASIAANGYAPTRAELSIRLGKSANAVNDLVHQLAAKGAIVLYERRHRGIALPDGR